MPRDRDREKRLAQQEYQVDEPQGELLCDIESGRLTESGRDPLRMRRHGSSASSSALPFEEPGKPPASAATGRAATAGDGALISVKAMSGGTEEILRLVVGLLGLEVHEAPSSWAESWLTFEDATKEQLGLGGMPDGTAPDPDTRQYRAQHTDWKNRVLSHLRGLLEHGNVRGNVRGAGGSADDGAGGAAAQPDGFQALGPDFQEHLQLAEFMLGKLTHTVGILDDPEKNNRPMALREYTEEMVKTVCGDLRQWLEQLAMLLSLYHVHILDLEQERRKTSASLSAVKEKCEGLEKERKDAGLRHDCVLEQWKEEKMKQRAEQLLGVSLQGDDAKIYSQKDVDEMMIEWEKEHVHPLLKDIEELRRQKDELLAKLSGKRVPQARPEDSGPPKETMKLIAAAVNALSDHVPSESVSTMMQKVGMSVEQGAGDMSELLKTINRMPKEAPTTNDAIPSCIEAVAAEIDKIDGAFRGSPGMDGLREALQWGRDSLRGAKGALVNDDPAFMWKKAPDWDVGSIGDKIRDALKRNSEAQTEKQAPPAETGTSEAQWQARLQRLKDELQAQIRALQAALEAEREKLRDALERLAAETKRADNAIAELRRKVLEMEALLRKAGLGKQAADAIFQAGLADFLQGRDVFERLYRDALHRMRRLAEAQMRIMEHASGNVMQAYSDIMEAPPTYQDEHRAPHDHAGQLHRGRVRTSIPSQAPQELFYDASHSPLHVVQLGPERQRGSMDMTPPPPGNRNALERLRNPSPDRPAFGLVRPQSQVILEPLSVHTLHQRDTSTDQSQSRSGSRSVNPSHSRERLARGPPARHPVSAQVQELLEKGAVEPSATASTWSGGGRRVSTPELNPRFGVGGVGVAGAASTAGGGGGRMGGSLLLPHGMRNSPERPPPSVPSNRPASMLASRGAPAARNLRSAPQLNPPRLLVQSVGSVF